MFNGFLRIVCQVREGHIRNCVAVMGEKVSTSFGFGWNPIILVSHSTFVPGFPRWMKRVEIEQRFEWIKSRYHHLLNLIKCPVTVIHHHLVNNPIFSWGRSKASWILRKLWNTELNKYFRYGKGSKKGTYVVQAGQWGFIKYRPPKKPQNIDQISTTQHFIDQISTAKVP